MLNASCLKKIWWVLKFFCLNCTYTKWFFTAAWHNASCLPDLLCIPLTALVIKLIFHLLCLTNAHHLSGISLIGACLSLSLLYLTKTSSVQKINKWLSKTKKSIQLKLYFNVQNVEFFSNFLLNLFVILKKAKSTEKRMEPLMMTWILLFLGHIRWHTLALKVTYQNNFLLSMSHGLLLETRAT